MCRPRRKRPAKGLPEFDLDYDKTFLGKFLDTVLFRKPPVRSFRIIRKDETPAAAAAPTVLPALVAPVKVAVASPAVTPAPKHPAPSTSGVPAFLKLFNAESDKMKALDESTKCVPRYLFRACWPQSGGGLKGLNTIDGVFPHAFVDGNGHRSIKEIPQTTLKNMANGHLRGQRPTNKDPIYSEFSSWAASLSLVLQYGHNWANSGGLICVLDRYNLPKNTTIYHCPSLHKAGLCDGPYCHEYLVHGPVEGPGFKAVPVKELVEIGLYKEIPIVLPGSRYWWGPIQDWDWEKNFVPTNIDEKKIARLRKIAKEFGPNFELAMTAAFTTVERKVMTSDGKFSQDDIRAFYNAVSDLDIPEEFGQGPRSIIQDGVYIKGYPMVNQLVELMKGLVEYSYGKGARARQKNEIKALAQKLEGVSVSTIQTRSKTRSMELQICGISDYMLDAIIT